jgi:beta-lactamase class A
MKSIRFLHFLLFGLVASGILQAQGTDKRLQKKLEELVKGFHGTAGIYVKNLKTGKTASVNGDTIFPTASMVKIPILLGITDKINKGELGYHDLLIYRDSLLYEGEDILGSFRDGEKIQLSKVLMLMLTTSDNTASLWLQQLAGSGTRINQILDSNGFMHTRVNSRTPGREKNRDEFGWGQTTPSEMGRLLESLYKGNLINPEKSGFMLRVLGRNYWDEEALSQIPPYIFTASKNGAVNRSRSESILVMAPSGPYVFSVITKNQEDERWDPDNAGWVLARKLSRLLWIYFEAHSSWKPSLGIDGKIEKN